MSETRTFNRQERNHLDVLERRLEYLSNQAIEQPENGHISSEISALRWALNTIAGLDEPVEIVVMRMEKALRTLASKVGRIERTLAEEEEA